MIKAIKQEIVFLKSTETNDILKLSLWDFGHLEDLTSANHVRTSLITGSLFVYLYVIMYCWEN